MCYECFFLINKVLILKKKVFFFFNKKYFAFFSELKNSFEIAPRDQLHIILFTKTAEEKNSWMANLIMLNTRR